jgi:predicted HTH domain antitoxin
MQLDVPDDIVYRAEMNALELHIALAVQLYADNRVDYSDACRLASLSPMAFNRELVSRDISIQQYPTNQAALRKAV